MENINAQKRKRELEQAHIPSLLENKYPGRPEKSLRILKQKSI